jgi:molybdopterin converting factor small subunit
LKVTVRFVGATRLVIGEKQQAMSLKKGTAKEVLDHIFKSHPDAREKLKQARLFVEGKMVKTAELEEPILREGQEVSVILPVAGG